MSTPSAKEIVEDPVKEIVEYCCKSVKPTVKNGWQEKGFTDHKEGTFQRSAQLFNDSVHGSIEVNSLERAIINSPEFFRLKDIKQLGGKFHVYHGATHTRFQHSIGVCHLAGEFMQHLKKQEEDRKIKENKISEEEELCVRIAGLCHDLGHGPFSHLFENVTECLLKSDKVHHELLSRLIFKKILLDNPKVLAIFVKDCKMTVNEVKKIEKMISPNASELREVDQEKEKMFLYEIIANKSSGMDVDKWDYFARDFLHLGVTYEFDWRRCMKLSSIVKPDKASDERRIGFRDKEVTNIYSMFRTRSILYFKALRHDTVEAIEMMLQDILCLAKDIVYETLYGTTSLMEVLEQAYTTKEAADLSGYVALTDSILHLIMHSPVHVKDTSEDLKKARILIDRLRRRELYKMIAEDIIEVKVTAGSPFSDELVHQERAEIKKMVKKYNEKCAGEIRLVCFKLSSEEELNPVEAMFFFPKPKEEFTDIPVGYKEDHDNIKSKAASPVCKPKKFIEYRIRMYRKELDSDVKVLKSTFEQCSDEIKAHLKTRQEEEISNKGSSFEKENEKMGVAKQ